MVKVFPITCPIVNWPEYLKWATSAIGRPITESLDKTHRELDASAFIVSLAEMRQGTCDPVKVIRGASGLLKHLSYGFLVIASQDLISRIQEESSLSVYSGNTKDDWLKIAVVSGNLKDWKIFIETCSHEQIDFSIRSMANQCQMFFEKAGFRDLWSGYQKSMLSDTTFKLLEKK